VDAGYFIMRSNSKKMRNWRSDVGYHRGPYLGERIADRLGKISVFLAPGGFIILTK